MHWDRVGQEEVASALALRGRDGGLRLGAADRRHRPAARRHRFVGPQEGGAPGDRQGKRSRGPRAQPARTLRARPPADSLCRSSSLRAPVAAPPIRLGGLIVHDASSSVERPDARRGRDGRAPAEGHGRGERRRPPTSAREGKRRRRLPAAPWRALEEAQAPPVLSQRQGGHPAGDPRRRLRAARDVSSADETGVFSDAQPKSP